MSTATVVSSAEVRSAMSAACRNGDRAASAFRYDADDPSSRQIAAAAADLRQALASQPHSDAAAPSASSPAQTAAWPKSVTIDVYAHVLRSKSGGGVPERRIERQIDVLNGAFAGNESSAAASSPFRFRLAHVDITVNGEWSRMDEGTIAETRAKRALHRGGATDLNLYIGRNRSGSLGWGTQPTRLNSAPMLDGVVIARHTMPGRSAGHYSAGDAAVHETGHWLGLFHTFAGKCGKRGDLVADTPREARPSYNCPVHRDTCTAPGDDPVHNYMDYSYDSCMNQFTHGQVVRMGHAWTALRAAAQLGATGAARAW
ncbi:MAG TPA: zinc metalloprotease [Nocardioidaceae bacterium]|nr:zinc metalloprotease [Nocardioidaceae bacterium]